MSENNASVGMRFSEIRKQLGYTQVQLAENLGTEQTVISRIEKDVLRITDEMLSFFYDKGVDLNYLFVGKGTLMRENKANVHADLYGAISLINQAINKI